MRLNFISSVEARPKIDSAVGPSIRHAVGLSAVCMFFYGSAVKPSGEWGNLVTLNFSGHLYMGEPSNKRNQFVS